MDSHLESFYETLPYRKNKKQAVIKLMDALYLKSVNNNVDVWPELYAVDIPAGNGVSKIEGPKIISKLREFLASKQKYRCCYCQRYLYNIAYARPVEHILPRTHFPRFSLVMDNLAISCFDCNSKKDDNIWWPTINKLGDYPTKNELAGAFHYNRHDYDEHIAWVSYATNSFAFSIYTGISLEGKKLYTDLLQDISKTDILLSRKDSLKSSMDALKLFRENGLGGTYVQQFIAELEANLMRDAGTED